MDPCVDVMKSPERLIRAVVIPVLSNVNVDSNSNIGTNMKKKRSTSSVLAIEGTSFSLEKDLPSMRISSIGGDKEGGGKEDGATGMNTWDSSIVREYVNT